MAEGEVFVIKKYYLCKKITEGFNSFRLFGKINFLEMSLNFKKKILFLSFVLKKIVSLQP